MADSGPWVFEMHIYYLCRNQNLYTPCETS